MEGKVLSLDGKSVGKVALPSHFEEPFRPDLIKRAVLAEQSWQKQKKSPDPRAGDRSSAKFFGARRLYGHYYGYGMARNPHIKIDGRPVGDARNIPLARKGRRAHPPLITKNIREDINKKERKKAIRSAIAATALPEIVKARGHVLGKIELPLVLDDKVQSLKKTKELISVLINLGLVDELERVSEKKVRAGRGKTRGRRYKQKVGPLIIFGENNGLVDAVKNIPGVDAVQVDRINAEMLAPGAHPGRLTIWTKAAVEKLNNFYR